MHCKYKVDMWLSLLMASLCCRAEQQKLTLPLLKAAPDPRWPDPKAFSW